MKNILILLFLCTIGTSSYAQQDWNLEKSEENITAYTRIKAGTNLKEIKIVTSINTSVLQLADALMDYSNFDKWQGGLQSIKMIDKKSDNETVIHYEVDLPWPMADREFIIRSIRECASNERCIVRMLADNSYTYSSGNEFVRMTELEGFWLIEAEGDNKVSMTYQFYSDPNGDVPEFLVNAFALDTPFKNIQSLKSLLQEGKL